MPDNTLIIVFGSLTALSLVVGVAGVYFALQSAKRNKSEISMAVWSIVALGGFTFAGMSCAYFLIPILMNWLLHG
jgi:hypothetical protein